MTAILLAGGRSARAGTDKATLELDGEMLVQRHLRQLRRAGVLRTLVVCNAHNEAAIRARTGARTTLQRGNSMSHAVLTGIDAIDDDAIALVCVNDIVGDEDYARIFATECGDATIVIPTLPLERRFAGGCLDLDATGAVRAIVENPDGGCPVGSAANVMIHRLRGRSLVERLASLLRGDVAYEAAVNRLLQEGVRVATVALRSWVAIKTPEDIARAREAADRQKASGF